MNIRFSLTLFVLCATIVIDKLHACESPTYFGCSTGGSKENAGCPAWVSRQAYDVLKGSVCADVDPKSGASASLDIHFGTPKALQVIGAEAYVKLKVKATAQPCNLLVSDWELEAEIMVKMNPDESCSGGNLVDCLYAAAMVYDHVSGASRESGMRRKFEDKACAKVVKVGNRRRTMSTGQPDACKKSWCDSSCDCEDYGWGSPPKCSNCEGFSVSCSSTMCAALFGKCKVAKNGGCAAGEVASQGMAAVGGAIAGMAGVDTSVVCEHLHYKIPKKKMRLDLTRPIKLSDILGPFGTLLNLLGTDAVFRIDRNTVVSSFTGVQFQILTDAWLLDLGRATAIPAEVRPDVVEMAEDLFGSSVVLKVENMNPLRLAFNIGPQLVEWGMLAESQVQSFKANLPSFLTTKEGYITIGTIDAKCSVDAPRSTLTLSDSGTSVSAEQVAESLSRAINAELKNAGVQMQIAEECKASALCNIQDVSITDGEISFTTKAGAGKNAGGLNDALKRAVESGLSIPGAGNAEVKIATDTTGLKLCSPEDESEAGKYNGCRAGASKAVALAFSSSSEDGGGSGGIAIAIILILLILAIAGGCAFWFFAERKEKPDLTVGEFRGIVHSKGLELHQKWKQETKVPTSQPSQETLSANSGPTGWEVGESSGSATGVQTPDLKAAEC